MTDPRVATLLDRLTVDEKLTLLHQASPAIPRLGLAAFHTGTEALHGVAWLGRATVFPQSVGLAATWDPDLLERVGAATGIELRAKRADDPMISLNAWAPVVNPLRHPLWGRNEEGYSEDPHLTATFATAFAAGLRGRHEKFWRTVPTLKHFLGYNNERDRDVSSSQLPLRVLHEYELPAFRGPIEAGVVGAVMPSYNLINGRPTHVSRDLIDELRSWSEESLLFVSDAYAPTNLAGSQGFFPDHVTSHAAALQSGIDSFTDNGSDPTPTIERLSAALQRGLITGDDIDRAVGRLLTLRSHTGEFDPDHDPHAAVGADAIDQPEHRALAREAAGKGVVLLRNDALLPLRTEERVAVVGPLGDRVLQDWYSGTPPYAVSVADGLREALATEVEVADGADRVTFRVAGTEAWLTVDQDGRVSGRTDGSERSLWTITDWGSGVVTLAAADGRLLTSADGRTLTATATRVGGWEVQESFRLHRHPDATWSLLHLGTGRWIRQRPGDARCELGDRDQQTAARFVLSVRSSGLAEVRAAAAGADTVIITVGNDPHLLGRETEDRATLALPEAQLELVRVAREANPRAVLLIISSYPYALNRTARTCPAVVWTSHGGQELGHGVADVLFGVRPPWGRLTQTWPASDQHLSDIMDYDIISTGSTYWYAQHEPLYPFGHGLTYGEIGYADLRCSEQVADPGVIMVELTVINSGDRPVSELVQVYTDAVDHRLTYPRRLAVHTRVDLEAGEHRTVALQIPTEQLGIFDVRERRMTVESGHYLVEVGRSVGDIRMTTTVEVDGNRIGPRRIDQAPVAAVTYDAAGDLDLLPRTPLSGDVVAPRRGAAYGWLELHHVDGSGLRGLRLRVRARGGGTITITQQTLGGMTVRGEVDLASADAWQTLDAPVAFHPGISTVHLRLSAGVHLDTLQGLTGSTTEEHA